MNDGNVDDKGELTLVPSEASSDFGDILSHIGNISEPPLSMIGSIPRPNAARSAFLEELRATISHSPDVVGGSGELFSVYRWLERDDSDPGYSDSATRNKGEGGE